MKIAVIIVRILLGAMFVFASVAYFFPLFDVPQPDGQMKVFNDGLAASGYIMQVVKSLELVCGLLLIFNRFVPLVCVVLFPILINIVLTHAFLAPQGLPLAIVLFLFDLFLAWHYRAVYAPMLKAKQTR